MRKLFTYNGLTALFLLACVVWAIGYHPHESAAFIRDLLDNLPREDRP